VEVRLDDARTSNCPQVRKIGRDRFGIATNKYAQDNQGQQVKPSWLK
jgi:hypothetical protein